ncbi:carotenoid biosynthesis protein [Rhodococcus sp. 15-1154-1]|nr:carotenoid biosynthesis protein [Rhodococcus sp. 15-1154-1]
MAGTEAAMNRFVWILAGSAVTAQIVYPLVSGSNRDVVTVAVVALLAASALAHAAITRGVKWAAVLFVTTAGLGIAAEIVGTATGFPFGSYFYATSRLGPDILGVPAVVPLAWTAGFYPIWCAVSLLLHRVGPDQRAPLHRIVMTAVAMVGWDLYLDTQMVTDGQWTWTSPIAGLPGIPSIPVTNYLGWFVVALSMAVIVEFAGKSVIRTDPPRLTDSAPIVLFMWTWLGSAFAHAVFLSGPEFRFSAIYGFVVMGTVGAPLAWTWTTRSRRRTIDTAR